MSELIKLPARYDEDTNELRDAENCNLAQIWWTDDACDKGIKHFLASRASLGNHIAHVLNTHDALVAAAKDVLKLVDNWRLPEAVADGDLYEKLRAALAAGEVKE